MSDLTDTVREALAKATPGPWEYEEPDGRHGADPSIGSAAEYISPFFGSKNDGDLITHAPAWLAELCDRLDAAEAAVPRIKAEALERESEWLATAAGNAGSQGYSADLIKGFRLAAGWVKFHSESQLGGAASVR